MRAGANVIALDHQNRSVVHYAARGGNPNALGLLAEVTKQRSLNASIDIPDHNGRTALHDAVRSGVLESVQILLNASANPNARDFKGKSCLHIPSECSEEQNIMDLQRLSQQNSLAECARHPADRKKRDYTGHPAGLKFVDSWRPVLTKKEEDGKIKPSRLDLEGVNRMTDIVRLLLDAGSDPNVTDDNRMTPPSLVVVMRLRGRILLAETHQTYPLLPPQRSRVRRERLYLVLSMISGFENETVGTTSHSTYHQTLRKCHSSYYLRYNLARRESCGNC